ncbi:HNH endonuclease [Vibrio mangrovi]|uniref:HNH endonuclease n=1 Tax=Vibrio mangrovi TaxID=474394 RepID=A0A1Y6IXD1_9VIBR|nr:HNH endonuclease [Vibrio mangrovi]MDW6004425.1 HNH endonuclease [Vibrio mangrovi]SMS00693.1 hypothetical protein VIM7927_01962 [Vibrio mangrovi]
MNYTVEKYLTKKDLKEANDAAVREKRNRALADEFVDNLDEDIKIPVWKIMYHAKNEIRLMLIINQEGDLGFLDVSILRYKTLPNLYKYDDGRIEFENRVKTDSKRPYPNGREWKESIEKKPVRKQSNFRDRVLKAYNSECCICDVKEKSLLRAAHIVAVVDGGPDTINNGLCLCVNHEIAFDRGLFRITETFNVEVISKFQLGIEVKKIKLPYDKNDYPISKYLKEKYARIV